MGEDTLRTISTRSLVLHDFHPGDLERLPAPYRAVVAGVEVDVYVTGGHIDPACWNDLVESFRTTSEPEYLAAIITDMARMKYEVYVDLKCPRGHESAAVKYTEALNSLVSLRDVNGLHVISRNHAFIESISRRWPAGIVVTDGLTALTSYVTALAARVLVASSLFLTTELVKELARADVKTLTFPPPTKDRLAEALALNPHRAMIDRELLAEIGEYS